MTDGLAYLAAIALALVFTYSALMKLRDTHPTKRALRAAGVPVGIARVVPFIELTSALLLLIVPTAGAVVALVVLISFTGFIASLLVRHIDVSCGCFGANATRSVSSIDVVRNVFLMAVGVVALSVTRPVLFGLDEFIAATTTFAIGAVVLAAMGTRADLGQLFDNRLPGER
jgi:Ca2+/Na+ antiporter